MPIKNSCSIGIIINAENPMNKNSLTPMPLNVKKDSDIIKFEIGINKNNLIKLTSVNWEKNKEYKNTDNNWEKIEILIIKSKLFLLLINVLLNSEYS